MGLSLDLIAGTPALDSAGMCSNAEGMKVAVSIPDDVFTEAESLALRSDETGLPKDSVANVSLVTALDKQALTDRLRKIPRRRFELILSGIDTILGR